MLDSKKQVQIAGLKDIDTPKLFQAQEYQGGRIAKADIQKFDFKSKSLQDELQKALTYVIGYNQYNPTQMRSLPAPQTNRFTQLVLDNDLYEPMQMTILPVSEQVFIYRKTRKIKAL